MNEKISLRGAAYLAFNALHECTPHTGSEKQYSDAIQALHAALYPPTGQNIPGPVIHALHVALHDIAYTKNLTATPQQFVRHLQNTAREALESTPTYQPATEIEKDAAIQESKE